jgi:type I restriction enzyme M protein
MFLHGIEDFNIVRGDTLRNPAFFVSDSLKTFDCVIANPPFSLDDWGSENWVNDPFGRNIAGVPPKGNGDMAWVQHMIKSMNSTGRMTVVLPNGVLFKKGAVGKIREELLKKDLLEAVICLGANIFYGTPLAPCILVFKQNKVKERKGKILFIDASQQIREGRAQNFLDKEHVEQIFKWYYKFLDVNFFVKVVTIDEIKEKNYFLNLPFYVTKDIKNNLPTSENALLDLKYSWNLTLKSEENFKLILKKMIK